jgi:hypothetical protein
LANATVLRVESQVVSGINFKTVYQSGYSYYYVTVYSQPWTNTLNVTSFFEAQASSAPTPATTSAAPSAT